MSRAALRWWRSDSARWRRVLKFTWRWGSRTAVLLAVVFIVLWHLCPFPLETVDDYPVGTRVVDRDGQLLRVYASERGEMCFPVASSEMSPLLRAATVAIEDKRYFSHLGVDPMAVLRAAGQNVWRGEIHSGASTLTMQLVRIAQGRPRTFASKVVESFYSLQINAWREKDDVLTDYLNLAPYGGNLRGVEAASMRYFGKPSKLLNLSQAALIAGLPQSPEILRPDRNYERALRRRRQVLDAMLSTGAIDQDQFARAIANRPTVKRHPWPFRAPHFSDLSRKRAGDDDVIRTTLDSDIQEMAERRLEEFFDANTRSRSRLNGGLVVLDIETSEIRAFVGSTDYFDHERRGMICSALAKRSSGSTLKPFLFALAFDRGLAAPSTYLADVPMRFRHWGPENFDHHFEGPVAASEALARSLNLPAIQLQRRVGSTIFLTKLRELGLSTLSQSAPHYGLTLSLGGGDVRLLDLVEAYASLADGQYREARWTTTERTHPRRVFSPAAGYLVRRALSSSEHLRRAGYAATSNRPMAYKTGTSRGFRDAWCVAFDERWVVGVWVGDLQGPAHPDLVGLRAAAPVALDTLRALPPSALGRPVPEGLVELPICKLTGYPVGRDCPRESGERSSSGMFLDAANPRVPHCRVHIRNPSGVVRENWPPAIRAWKSQLVRSRVTRRSMGVERVRGGRSSPAEPRILSPIEGSEFRRLTGAPFDQALYFSASLAEDARTAFWFVNGHFLSEAAAGESVSWLVTPGDHEIRCVDDLGRVARSTIRVH